jgi:PEGA domain-containing protein
MTISKGFLASAVLATGVLCAAPSYAQARGGGHAVSRAAVPVRTPGPAPTLGHAVPRPPYAPGHYPGYGYPYRPYYPYYPYYRPYYYGPGFNFGLGFYYGYPGFSFGVGFGYPYYGYGYPYYGYPYYGYPYYPYYGVPYAGGGYAAPPGGGYAAPTPGGAVSAAPGGPSGGIRIQDAPRNTEVYVDGQHVGVVEDFDGTFQHLSLAPGPHRIELRAQGYETLIFDAHIDPGQTVNYRAHMRHQQ